MVVIKKIRTTFCRLVYGEVMKYTILFFLFASVLCTRTVQSTALPKFGFMQQLFTAAVINGSLCYWCYRYNAYNKYIAYFDKHGDVTQLSDDQRRNIRNIFRFHGVHSVYICDRKPEEKKGLSVVAFLPGKTVLNIPHEDALVLENKKVFMCKKDGQELYSVTREEREAGIHHEAVHAKHQDATEACLAKIIPISFSLLAAQMAYVKHKPDVVGGLIAAFWVANVSYALSHFLVLFRKRQIEKRCDLSIPTSRLAHAAADYHQKLHTKNVFLGYKDKSFFDQLFSTHPSSLERAEYMRKHALALEKQEKVAHFFGEKVLAINKGDKEAEIVKIYVEK